MFTTKENNKKYSFQTVVAIVVLIFLICLLTYDFLSLPSKETSTKPVKAAKIIKPSNPSIISPHLQYCSQNPFLNRHREADIVTYEAFYAEWWKTRYLKLFQLLTEYHNNPAVDVENPSNENYDNLNQHRAGDGLLDIIYDVHFPFPCLESLKPWGSGPGTAKMLCGMEEHSNANECIVYSLGSRNTFDFEQSLSHATNCQIYTFDCTSEPPSAPIPRVQFEKFCFGPQNIKNENNLQLKLFPIVQTPSGWESKSLIPILKSIKFDSYYSVAVDHLNHDHVSVLKIDIESGEYSVFVDLFDSSNEKYNKNLLPYQIAIETHWWNRGIAHAMLNLEMFNTLYFNGYRVMSHEKQIDSACFELTWMRVFC
jgi:hypothetical protein